MNVCFGHCSFEPGNVTSAKWGEQDMIWLMAGFPPSCKGLVWIKHRWLITADQFLIDGQIHNHVIRGVHNPGSMAHSHSQHFQPNSFLAGARPEGATGNPGKPNKKTRLDTPTTEAWRPAQKDPGVKATQIGDVTISIYHLFIWGTWNLCNSKQLPPAKLIPLSVPVCLKLDNCQS